MTNSRSTRLGEVVHSSLDKSTSVPADLCIGSASLVLKSSILIFIAIQSGSCSDYWPHPRLSTHTKSFPHYVLVNLRGRSSGLQHISVSHSAVMVIIEVLPTADSRADCHSGRLAFIYPLSMATSRQETVLRIP